MGYSVYYNGEITVSPQLGSDHAALFDEALRTDDVARLGITPEDRHNLCHGCDWQYSDGALSIEGESRSQQETWLRLLVARFFQPNGYTLAGEVAWDGSDSGDTGVIYVDKNRIEAVDNTISSRGPAWRPRPAEPAVAELVRAGRNVLAHWERGDLAAAVRALSDALQSFAELPDEG